MAVNRTKVLEAAQKFLSKGQYDKAIAEYQKLVVEDPRDVRTLLKIGDLHTRRNKPKDAVGVYEKVAELYAKQGFFLKAVAVHKQILKLDPTHLAATLKLAQMYEELALASDALTTYEQAADAYLGQGQTHKALEIMEHMIGLDAHNVAARIKYAEALSKANKAAEAASAFAEGARLLREQGRIDDYIRVVERQLYHDPDNVHIARELSGKYLERNDPKRALAKLQVCFKADPRDVQTLEMLAEAFRQLGQIPKTVSVLKEIARLHGEVSAEEPRRRTLLRVLDLDPTDVEAKQALTSAGAQANVPVEPVAVKTSAQPEGRPTQAPLRRATQDQAEPPASEEELLGDEDLDDDLSLLEDDVEEPEALLIVAEDSIPAPAPEPSGPSYASVSGLLVAAEGYESNGNYEQAEEALKNILLLDETNHDAHERLKDIYLATDRRVDAVRELLWLSEAWDMRSLEHSQRYALAAFELAPHAEATRNRLEALGIDPDTGEPTSHTEEVVFVDESSEDLASPDAHDRRAYAREEREEPAESHFAEPAAHTHRERPSVRSEAELASDSLDPLDIPFDPDDFEETRQPRATAHTSDIGDAEMVDLLDQPISPDDFDESQRHYGSHLQSDTELGAAGDSARPMAPIDQDMAALLDAPISPDEFDAAPPERRAVQPVAQELLDEPIDDFGLSDDSFDRSDLHEVTPSPGVAVSPWPASALGSPGSVPSDGRTEETAAPSPLDVGETAALSGASTTTSSTDELDLPHLDEEFAFDDEPEHTRREALPSLEDMAGVETVSDDQLLAGRFAEQVGYEADDLAEAPDPTVPAEPIPELIRRSSLANLGAVQPAPDTMSAPSAPTPSAPEHAEAVLRPEEVITPEIEEALDEAEFFASQSLLDEALEVVQEAMLIYPGSAALKERLLEYKAKAEQEDAEAKRREDDLALDQSFGIAEKLASELAEVPASSTHDDMVDVESVFAQFKKGVAQQIGEDDTDTHFDLGIAYKEMGLLDDAIAEFEVSARSPARTCTALTMVGMCHVEKGDPMRAVGFFERALNGSVRGPAEELALGYEIGNAYELAGHPEKAMLAFERVAARDRTFRGVAARVDQLKRRGVGSSNVSGITR